MMSSADGFAHKLEEGAASYGAAGMAAARKEMHDKGIKRERVGLVMVVACVLIPWLIFLVTFWALSFSFRYEYPSAAFAVAWVLFACVILIAVMTIQAARGKGGDPLWLGLLFVLSAVGWTWGYIGGNSNYVSYAQPFYDLNQLNVYESVDPSKSRGNQYMDAGVIGFTDKTVINRAYAMSFKDDDVYCVAPIAVPNVTSDVYDFWAIGKNCCNQHLFNFKCGEYNSPYAHTGVRLVDAAEEQLFQIVVKQAQAAYNLPTAMPMMFTWVSNPSDQISAYQDDAVKYFIREAFYWFIITVVLTVVSAVVFAKL